LTQGPRIIERASKASSVRVWTWGHSSPAWIARRRTPVTVPRLTASLGIVRCSLRRLPRLPEQPLPLHARHAPPAGQGGTSAARVKPARRAWQRGSFCPSENEPGVVAIQVRWEGLILQPGADGRDEGGGVLQQAAHHPLHPALADAADPRRVLDSQRPSGTQSPRAPTGPEPPPLRHQSLPA